MGQLEAACFSLRSDSTLYALVFGYDLSKKADNAIVALIKSNPSPSGPDALTWQVVSTVHKAELPYFQLTSTFGNRYPIQCLVDPNGVFLAWSYQASQPGQARSEPRPGGFRYDPFSTTPSATTTGKGGWVNVDSPITYSWTGSSGGALMYLADGAGKYNYYHAYLDSLSRVINFGALNTAVTPNLMENSVTKWTLDTSITGNLKTIRISATNLFVWGWSPKGFGELSFSVATLPQNGPLPTTAPLVQSANYTTVGTCADSGVLGNLVYTYCADRKTHGEQYSLYEWNGSKGVGSHQYVQNTLA